MPVWDPFQEISRIQRELDRIAASQPGGKPQAAFLPGRQARAYPLTNLYEDADNIYVEALAPGIDPVNLNLTVVRNTLTVAGEKLAPPAAAAESFHRSERAAGKFIRNIDLPVEVDSDKVTARYVDGLLFITLPKAEAAKPRQISVKVG
jgi:HSP20 family protein